MIVIDPSQLYVELDRDLCARAGPVRPQRWDPCDTVHHQTASPEGCWTPLGAESGSWQVLASRESGRRAREGLHAGRGPATCKSEFLATDPSNLTGRGATWWLGVWARPIEVCVR